MVSPIFFINQVIAALRCHFEKQNFLGFFSPILVESAAMEPYLDAFEAKGNFGSYYMPTSPEFALKKAFALYPAEGAGVYDIARAFRDEHLSASHCHEFSMLEWYRRNACYEQIIEDVVAVLQVIINEEKKNSLTVSSLLQKSLSTSEQQDTCHGRQGQEKILSNVKVFSVAELFQKFLGFVLTPTTSFAQLLALAERHKIYFRHQDEDEKILWVELYSVLMDELIEPRLAELADVLFVKDYPPLTRAMSCLDANGWAMRIECYVHGQEIANGYSELADPAELKKIWTENNRLRLRQNKKIHPLDNNLIELTPLMQGVCGTALGLERTLTALYPRFSLRDFFL